jgi:glycosyltransferase involved in cell wall biosynthesis
MSRGRATALARPENCRGSDTAWRVPRWGTNTQPVLSIVVPVHNEAAVIGRLLKGLLSDAAPGEFEIVVVANGCTDDTAAIVASYGPDVTVVSTPIPSKVRAMRLGDAHAHGHPRLYIDADVELSTRDVRALAQALAEPGVLAVAPARTVALTGRPLAVRWYYDVWEALPGVRDALYGRGVIGVNAEGQARIAAGPEVIGDDMVASLAFKPHERRIVPTARVVVNAPWTTSDLLLRRIRNATGTAQLREHMPEAVDGARTTRSDLVRLAARHPILIPKLLVFLGITVIARRRARRPIRDRDYTTWLRDESSRRA